MITRSDTCTNAGPCNGFIVRQRRTDELSTCNRSASSSVVYQRPSISLLIVPPRSRGHRPSCRKIGRWFAGREHRAVILGSPSDPFGDGVHEQVCAWWQVGITRPDLLPDLPSWLAFGFLDAHC